jgi:hypothetical protein
MLPSDRIRGEAQPEFHTPDGRRRHSQLESEAVGEADIAEFTSRFEVWLFTEFCRTANVELSDAADPVGLTLSLLSWVNELRDFGLKGTLQQISAPTAAKLHCLVNYALDRLEVHYLSVATSPATMILALSPLDDLLVFLSLAARERRASSTSA